MSRESSNLSGRTWDGASSPLPRRGRVIGVPKICWCGEPIVALNSKSENNPCRRYFRCSYAVSEKVWGDDHIFKWVDEGVAEEIDMLKVRNAELQEELKSLKYDRLLCDMKLENDIVERVEGILGEAQTSMKKMVVQIVIGSLVLGVCIKLLG